MLTTLVIIYCLGAALISGVFFAFSTFVMKALFELPAVQGIAAMRRINVVVLNPLFLGVFMGTAALGVACALAAFLPWAGLDSWLLIGAALAYLIGCFGVTAACNVPRNERLAPMADESAEAAAYWPTYYREWLFWNHVRTLASMVAAALAALALAA